MKFVIYIIFLNLLIFPVASQELDYSYSPEEVINYINDINRDNYNKEDFENIIENIINTFRDAYTFYEISLNPPQPSFEEDYFKAVDIYNSLKDFKEQITDDMEVYDFYRGIISRLSELKDCHILINWNILELDEFTITSPFEFEIREDEEDNGRIKMYVNCVTEKDFYEDIMGQCIQNQDSPILKINDLDPFDYINNFGGKIMSTKNVHGTFSFKYNNNYDVLLSNYPLSLEELNYLKIQFITGEEISTSYSLESNLEISEEIREERRNLRNLNNKNISSNLSKSENKSRIFNKKNKFKNKKIKKRRKLQDDINWYLDKDIIKCKVDDNYEINLYYISSFLDEDKIFIDTIEECYKLFDNNKYPIIVINDLNDGGYVYLSQIFLGILSPLMSIDIYKGRMRITDSFKDTEEIKYYIETNLTSSENCLHTNYEELLTNKITAEYGSNKEYLTQLFFINNITIHNQIETFRRNMVNKRKPTEILVYTDGYSFSAASLFLNYLQRSGGGIIASYMGNPNLINDKPFDISQSPSPIFNSKILKIFSENYNNLLSLNERNEIEDEDEWEIEMPGIQTFYNNSKVNLSALEYEVTLPDENSQIYQIFDAETYNKFLSKSKEIFEKYKTKCNPNNTYLVKVSEECDNKFSNSYTHGGYKCGEDGNWSDECIPTYCDPGYFFHKVKNKCVKDICSSIPVTLEEEEIETGSHIYKLNHSYLYIFLFIFYLLNN